MTPKEKAQQLYGYYYQILMGYTKPNYRASKIVKECALRVVIEVRNDLNKIYWNKVKEEIERL